MFRKKSPLYIQKSLRRLRRTALQGKDGFEEELGDAVQRILHLCGVMGIDIEKAILAELEYNKQRVWDWGNMNEGKH